MVTWWSSLLLYLAHYIGLHLTRLGRNIRSIWKFVQCDRLCLISYDDENIFICSKELCVVFFMEFFLWWIIDKGMGSKYALWGSCEHVMCDFSCRPRHDCIKLWGQDHLHMGHFQAHWCANFPYEAWSVLDLGNLPINECFSYKTW
jgi:hypothetical protein